MVFPPGLAPGYRFWDTPGWPIIARNNVWRELLNDEADWLNAGDLEQDLEVAVSKFQCPHQFSLCRLFLVRHGVAAKAASISLSETSRVQSNVVAFAMSSV
jgi:hypothetical protein